MDRDIEAILQFWFGALDDRGLLADPGHYQLWFNATPEQDARCRQRFGSLVDAALAGSLAHWAADDRGLLALVLLLDQFPRNIHRGTPKAFSGDPQAQALVQAAIDAGRHLQLPAMHRVFLYLPLEHSESLALQDQCVALFEELLATTGLEELASYHRYAVAHREVIARFGRFPHRNAALGRTSTDAEREHLNTHGGF